MREINWNNITLNQYFILQKKLINVKGRERALFIACELHGLNVENEKLKGVQRLAQLIDSISFFGELPMNPSCTAVIDGKEKVFKPLASITSGEFLDIQSYAQDDNLNELETCGWQVARLSASEEIKLLPVGEGHKSSEIIERWHEKILQMSMSDFLGLYAFFLNKQKNSASVFLLYLVNQLNKETKKRLTETRISLMQYGLFSLSLKKWRLKILEVYLTSYRKLLAVRCSSLRLSWNLKREENEL
jgi:hypothetical protein